MNLRQKPLKPFNIDPKAFLSMVEFFIEAYPQYSDELKLIAEKGEDEISKIELSEKKGMTFLNQDVNYTDYTRFWERYLDIEDILYAGHLIKNCLFVQIKSSNLNAIFKASGVQNISYSIVVSKVGIKIELLIKTLRSDIKDKKKFNKIIFDEIKKSRNEISKKIKNVVWERLDNRVYSRIYLVIEKKSLNNKVNLPRLTIKDIKAKKDSVFEKMAISSDKFYRVFDLVIKKLNIKKIEEKL